MTIKIAIASGKGGTGKTCVSLSLYYFLSKEFNNQVQLIDCDVEEPNDTLFFSEIEGKEQEEVFSLVPKIDNDKCTFCKKCAKWCEFNAITIVDRLQLSNVNTDLCHSCGVCTLACNFGAIIEYQKPLGIISEMKTPFGLGVTEGRLEIGSSMQTSLIKKVKKYADNQALVVLFDSPPGTSCPVVETVSDTDYVILVTEPTPFGLNDLKISVELLFDLDIPFGVIVNKADIGNNEVLNYLEEKGIELLGKIPFSKDYARNYADGQVFENIPCNIRAACTAIGLKLKNKIATT